MILVLEDTSTVIAWKRRWNDDLDVDVGKWKSDVVGNRRLVSWVQSNLEILVNWVRRNHRLETQVNQELWQWKGRIFWWCLWAHLHHL